MRKSFRYISVLLFVYLAAAHGPTIKEGVSYMWEEISALRFSGGSLAIGKLQGDAAILIDEKTGKILYGKNEHERLYPASTTKIVTALLALEKGDPEDIVEIGDEVRFRTAGESSSGLVEGQRITLRDLVSALMLPSGNDAARTIARYVTTLDTGHVQSTEDSISHFAQLMNERAEEIGAIESHFVNPHGLHDPEHYTTAHDLALIAQVARTNTLFRQIVSETERTINTGHSAQTLVNRNKLLQEGSEYYYQGANGIKTGYTGEAGYCLVASAERGDANLIAVVLHSTSADVWYDAQKMLEYGFDRIKK
nr:D-alanyl-D-alanine carboxypeptidase family protein [Paenibacillus oenotherae]